MDENALIVLEWQDAIKNGFTGKDGTHYRLEGGLSGDRYVKMQEYLVELYRAGGGIMDVFDLAKGAFDDLQHPKIMDAGQKLLKIFDIQRVLSSWPHPAMKACALYFNADSDTRDQREAVDESDIIHKCNNWGHITIESFFELLGNIRSGSKANSSVNSAGESQTN